MQLTEGQSLAVQLLLLATVFTLGLQAVKVAANEAYTRDRYDAMLQEVLAQRAGDRRVLLRGLLIAYLRETERFSHLRHAMGAWPQLGLSIAASIALLALLVSINASNSQSLLGSPAEPYYRIGYAVLFTQVAVLASSFFDVALAVKRVRAFREASKSDLISAALPEDVTAPLLVTEAEVATVAYGRAWSYERQIPVTWHGGTIEVDAVSPLAEPLPWTGRLLRRRYQPDVSGAVVFGFALGGTESEARAANRVRRSVDAIQQLMIANAQAAGKAPPYQVIGVVVCRAEQVDELVAGWSMYWYRIGSAMYPSVQVVSERDFLGGRGLLLPDAHLRAGRSLGRGLRERLARQSLASASD